MEIKIEIKDINYGDLAVKCMPLIRDKLESSEGTVAKILSSLTRLPPNLIRGTLDVLPQETKDEIAMFLISKNKEKIIDGITHFAVENGVDIAIGDITVSE